MNPYDPDGLLDRVIIGGLPYDGPALLREIGHSIGFGRSIQVLKNEWSDKLVAGGMPRETADEGARIVCVWCGVDERTGKKRKARKGAK